METLFDVYHGEAEVENTTVDLNCEDGDDFVQCQSGEPKCYHRQMACVYDTAVIDQSLGYTVQKHCRDGAHLRQSCGK